MPFISPMAPFLDPGSRAWANPQKFGYSLRTQTLAGHIEAITQPSWKYILNYRSRSLPVDALVDATYQAALGLNRLKAKAGAITSQVMQQNQNRILHAVETMEKIDRIMEEPDKHKRKAQLEALKKDTDRYSMSTVCEKKELEFPLFNRSFRWFHIIRDTICKAG